MPHNIISMEAERPSRILVIVDYSNLLYRAFFSSMVDLEKRPWLPFVRALDMLRTCVKKLRNGDPNIHVEFIFAGDSVRKKLDRMKVDENYKEDRPALTNLNFYIFRHVMAYVVADLGLEIFYHDGSEADDVIASIVKTIRPECKCERKCKVCACMINTLNTDVVIFSNDRDMNPLLGYSHTTIYRPPGIFYTREDFCKEFGFQPHEYITYKALVGDRSDGIKPLPLWGDLRAKTHILKKDVLETVTKNKTLEKFQKNLELLKLNYEIPIPPFIGAKPEAKCLDVTRVKILGDYHREEAVEDVIFAEKRLVDACEEVFE